jgi:glycosyltransferase involved in cell wall biosynthesis
MLRASVCIPTRNRAGDIAERLVELRQQTIADLEIVIVNDGSTDETAEVVQVAASEDPRIRLVSLQPEIGMPAVVARCFSEARAEYVATFHDHDMYASDAVEKLLDALEAVPDASFSFSGVRTIDPETCRLVDNSADPAAPRARSDVTPWFVRTGQCLVAASAVMVRKSRLPEGALSPELGLFADVALWCRLAATTPAAYTPGPVATVQGWTRAESLRKLNWGTIGRLAALRIELAPHVAAERRSRARLLMKVHGDTLRARAGWTLRVVREARRNHQAVLPALMAGPRVIRWLVGAIRRLPGSSGD